MKLTVAGVLLVVGALGSHGASAQINELSSIAGAPFSGVRTEQSGKSFADGNRIDQGTSIRLYRDREGRTRIERDTPAEMLAARPGMDPVQIVINDPVSGDIYQLHPLARKALVIKGMARHTIPLPTSVPGISVRFGGYQYGPKNPGWSEPQSLGQKSINGVNAVGSRRQYTIAAGVKGNQKPIVLTVEQWFDLQLGLIVAKTAKATLGGEFHTEVENIDARDPDPSLFTVPADYTRTEINPKAVADAAMKAVAKDSGQPH